MMFRESDKTSDICHSKQIRAMDWPNLETAVKPDIKTMGGFFKRGFVGDRNVDLGWGSDVASGDRELPKAEGGRAESA